MHFLILVRYPTKIWAYVFCVRTSLQKCYRRTQVLNGTLCGIVGCVRFDVSCRLTENKQIAIALTKALLMRLSCTLKPLNRSWESTVRIPMLPWSEVKMHLTSWNKSSSEMSQKDNSPHIEKSRATVLSDGGFPVREFTRHAAISVILKPRRCNFLMFDRRPSMLAYEIGRSSMSFRILGSMFNFLYSLSHAD